MPEQIYIGNFAKGLKLDRDPQDIDNDAFPTLYNAYAWRGTVKRKRGTRPLARLQQQILSVASPTLPYQNGALALSGGIANLVTGYALETNSSIAPGTITLTVSGNTYTEPSPPDGTLLKNGVADPGSAINYATGAISIAGGGSNLITGTFSYFPDLPVLGLEDFVSNLSSSKFPLVIAFDPLYAYQLAQPGSGSKSWYNVTYYKGTNIPFNWLADDSHQFWSANYQSAFWVTNNNPGLHLVNGAYVSGSGTNTVTFTFTNPAYSSSPSSPYQNLIVGDKLFFNEWPIVSSPLIGPDNLVGTVSNITGAAAGTYQVTFASIITVSLTGIAQLLTNSLAGQDGIRWYDGDPTSATGIPTGTGLGWVNFAPPLTGTSVSIDDQGFGTYYLVGALAILPFKDRLLFFGPMIQTSAGAVIQTPIQDNVLWSWNGTPYYNSLVPTSGQAQETSDPTAYYVDQTGKGGYLPAGVDQPIVTVMNNEDVLLIGFGGTGLKTRFVYTGNDLQPFLFYLINSELPSSSTFSGVVLDRGGIEIGQYGITMTTQQGCQRVDLDIPDEVFTIQNLNNGNNRVNAIRDFQREWIYFSYPTGDGANTNGSWVYPSQSFLFNYRDNTWSILRENFTHHGTYRAAQSRTWLTIGYQSWSAWREPWNSGVAQALFPEIIAGNPQGYVVIKSNGTGEAPTGAIAALSNDGLGNTQVTSINHCVNSESSNQGTGGDYLYFLNSIGTTTINGQIGLVIYTIDANNFVVDIPFDGNTYLGLGTYTRLSQPLIQTKQFPVYWQEGRQVRLLNQKYLLEGTQASQITININLSQDADTAYNEDPIIPSQDVTNSGLVYSQLLYTCPESTNLGLTPANTNLQMPTAINQAKIWHRMNTTLIGDTFQVGFTLSDSQMRNITYATDEISLHGIQFTVDRGPLLS